jgi:N-acetylmuramoyl-L-alanine amidase
VGLLLAVLSLLLAVPPAESFSHRDSSTLDQMIRASRRRVVLDPGHGGEDPGAIGVQGAKEKDVVLAIAQQVRSLLQGADVDVLLTRRRDTYVSLAERTSIANRFAADAFVSIHANAAPGPLPSGIETYYLNVSADRYALRLAARENQTSVQKVSELQLILADLSTKATTQASIALAQRVQANVVQRARGIYRSSRDLGVKPALFYVLMGTKMPAILVETAFISHPDEGRLLQRPDYQQAVARGIAESLLGL